MTARFALGPILVVLLVVATTTSAVTATQPSAAPGHAQSFAPLTLPPVTDGAEAASDGVLGPGTAVPDAAAVLADPGAPPVPTNPVRVQPATKPGVVVKTAPRRYVGRTTHVLRGAASWYCNANPARDPISACHQDDPDTAGWDAYAAAGPRLRAALGASWRGRIVSVDGLRVKLVDWCQCYAGQANEKVIDLYRDVYGVAGGSVTIRW